MKKTALGIMLLGSVANVMFPVSSYADKKVYAPYVEKGEVEIESRSGFYTDEDESKDNKYKHKVALGYGITDFWLAEIYGEWEKDGAVGSESKFSAVEFENIFQFTKANEYWADLGAVVEYAHETTQGSSDKVEAKLIAAKKCGDFLHLLNAGIEREVGKNSNDDNNYVASWSSRYKLSTQFQPGFEIHSEFSDIADTIPFQQQEHYAGPVFYGKVAHVGYELGFLAGASKGANDGLIKLNLEYEFEY